jgi:hypothetical protein
MSLTYIILLPGQNLILFRFSSLGFSNLFFLAFYGYVSALRQGAGNVLIQGFSQISIGPLLRGEKDKRNYFKSFETNILELLIAILMHYCYQYLPIFFPRLMYLRSLSRIYKPREIHTLLETVTSSDLPYIRSFYETRIKTSNVVSQVIGVHIRLGDFTSDSCDHTASFNVRASINYYINAISRLREYDPQITTEQIRIYTDSPKSPTIINLVKTYGFSLDVSPNVQTSILSLSNSKMLVLSRSSLSLLALMLSHSCKVVVLPNKSPFSEIAKRLFPNAEFLVSQC